MRHSSTCTYITAFTSRRTNLSPLAVWFIAELPPEFNPLISRALSSNSVVGEAKVYHCLTVSLSTGHQTSHWSVRTLPPCANNFGAKSRHWLKWSLPWYDGKIPLRPMCGDRPFWVSKWIWPSDMRVRTFSIAARRVGLLRLHFCRNHCPHNFSSPIPWMSGDLTKVKPKSLLWESLPTLPLLSQNWLSPSRRYGES